MGQDTFLIVGLGNPGERYQGTRHNIGFVVVDALAQKYACQVTCEKWGAFFVRTTFLGQKVCLVKPQTYMNLSGKAAVRFVDFYKIPLQNLLVIHDDLDMKPGRIKLVLGGGHGGHKGIRSLVQYLSGNNFFRLKIGIGRPGLGGVHPEIPVENYVLSKFLQEERDLIAERMETVIHGVECFLQGNTDRAMNMLNSLK